MKNIWNRFFVISLIYMKIINCNSNENMVVTFDGDNSEIYNRVKTPIVSTLSQISLNFKTKQDNSSLFYIGSESTNPNQLQFLFVSIEFGQIKYQLRHSDRVFINASTIPCISSYWTCADNRWHRLIVEVQEKWFKITVDGKNQIHKDLGQIFKHPIYGKHIFGGKFPSIGGLITTTKNLKNFKGCFKKMKYVADSVTIDIIKEAKSGLHFTYRGNQVYFGKCSDLFPIEPVSFTRPNSYITIPGWAWAQKGRLNLAFKTVEQNSLLVYQNSENLLFDQFDFYAFELREGRLQFSINTGSGVISSLVSDSDVADGQVHHIQLLFDKGQVEVKLDTMKKHIQMNRRYRVLDISGDLFIGGVPESLVGFLPYSVWSGKLRQGFVGCIVSVSTDEGGQYDLALRVLGAALANRVNNNSRPKEHLEDNLKYIHVGCSENGLSSSNSNNGGVRKNYCTNRPCMDGICSVGYNRYKCDCTRTNYTGSECNRVAPVVQFNGYQFMKIHMPNSGIQTESEDVTLRFQTTRPNGMLLATRNRVSGAKDRLEIFLRKGRIQVLMNFGQKNTIIQSNLNCFDGKWHTVKLKRRELSIVLTVDDSKVKKNLTGSSKLLFSDSINIGRLQPNQVRYDSTQRTPLYFTGFMMHFIFNGINYFELMQQTSPANIEVTATLDHASIHKEFPVTFTNFKSYMRLPKIDMYGDFKLDFFIRTSTISGSVLLLYGSSSDFLVLEISGGYMILSFDWGQGYNKKINKYVRVDDGKWHRVVMVREDSARGDFAFRIDGKPKGQAANIALKKGGLNFNKFEDLYLGSAEKYSDKKNFKKLVKSDQGFVGCIASFYMNKTLKHDRESQIYQNLLTTSLASKGVKEGCDSDSYHVRRSSNGIDNDDGSEFVVKCRKNFCQSGGRCIQQWTRVRCDCSMTSFTGERCDKVSKTLKFNDPSAYLIYKMYPSKNTSLDELAFGMQTSRVTSSSLVRIEGGRGGDFIGIELIKEKERSVLIVKYNMGSGSIHLKEDRINFADGYYHRIAFRRHANNATLRVDNLTPQTFIPKGRVGMHFNEQRTIFVGSKSTPSPHFNSYSINRPLYRGFSGYISGLYFNQIPLCELVDNISYSGIRLLNRSNVYIENKFIPNFKKQPQDNLLSEQEVNHDGKKVSKNQPIVIARARNCTNISPFQYQQCKEQISGGIIRPVITIKYPKSTTTSATKLNYDNNSDKTNKKDIIPDSSLSSPAPSSSIKSNKVDNTNSSNSSSVAPINIWLIVGFSLAGCILLIIISCFIYRCCRQDEGSYSVEDDRIMDPSSCKPLTSNNNNHHHNNSHHYHGNGHQVGVALINNGSSSGNAAHSSRRQSNNNTSDMKEWYV